MSEFFRDEDFVLSFPKSVAALSQMYVGVNKYGDHRNIVLTIIFYRSLSWQSSAYQKILSSKRKRHI